MGSYTAEVPNPWIETPLIYSAPISKAAGCNIYLKLENLQPSGSFKSRGIGNLVSRAAASAASNGEQAHYYCSSGGNAGLACATAAAALEKPATIVVPLTTSPYMVSRLRELPSVEVVQTGANWSAADKYMREELIAKHDAGRAVYVPPFDHQDVWDGAATMMEEIARQMPPGKAVDAIACSVGGGGLLCGIMQGIYAPTSSLRGAQPRVLAVETEGAASLRASIDAGEIVTLKEITSIATSLGAPRVAQKAYDWAAAYPDTIISSVVSDGDAVMGSVRLLDDARLFVEPACGATIAPAYNGQLRRCLGKDASDDDSWASRNVVLVVCGGSNINLSMLAEYRAKYDV